MKQILCGLMLVVTVITSSCNKENEDADPVPVIEFISISPQQVTEYRDSIVLVIQYTDGDGDLGENSSTAKNLFVKDSRNGVTYSYRIQQLAPMDANITIRGKLNIQLTNTAIVGIGDTETVTYEIYVKDRAGNESNRVNSTPLTVTKL